MSEPKVIELSADEVGDLEGHLGITPTISIDVDEAGMPVVYVPSGMDASDACLLLLAAAQQLNPDVSIPDELDPRALWVRVSSVPPRVITPGLPQRNSLRVEGSGDDYLAQVDLLLQVLLPHFRQGMEQVNGVVAALSAELRQRGIDPVVAPPAILDPRKRH